MELKKIVLLKDGRPCLLRHATAEDAQAVIENFLLTHGQTEFLTGYPEEYGFTVEGEAQFLQAKAESPREVQLIAELDGVLVGSAGIDCVRDRIKTRHRATLGVSVDRAYWGLGVGRALTEACVACAEESGYAQLELEAVAENAAALCLYRSLGFVEYGRNPLGFRTREGRWQELVLMRLEFERNKEAEV